MPAWPRRPACASSLLTRRRGSNENTNGLLRQYLPKGSSLAGLGQDDLDLAQRSVRKTLDYATPNEALNSLIATLARQRE